MREQARAATLESRAETLLVLRLADEQVSDAAQATAALFLGHRTGTVYRCTADEDERVPTSVCQKN